MFTSRAYFLEQCLADNKHPSVSCYHHYYYHQHFLLLIRILFMGMHIFPFAFANSASGNNLPSLFHVCEFMDALQQVQYQSQGVYEFVI